MRDKSFPVVRPMTPAEAAGEGRRLPPPQQIHSTTLPVDMFMKRNRTPKKRYAPKPRTAPDAPAVNVLSIRIDHASSAQRRWSENVPAGIRDEIDRLMVLCSQVASGPETTESLDAIVNEWLEPYGIAQKSTWDKETHRLSVEMTTLEALEAGNEND